MPFKVRENRERERAAAAEALQDFLDHHSEFPTGAKIRENIERLPK